jgi:hypothetical protein
VNSTASPTPTNGANGAAPAAGAANAPSQPPLFYGRPLPLSAEYHAKFKIRPENDFSFAGETNAIPITLPEFVMCGRHYPIIFIGEELIPSIAVGLRADDNLFVDVKGQWAVGHYIPAYVRRYPFLLMGSEADEQLRVGIDDDARSSKEGAQVLFEDGKETEAVRRGITLCEQFHGAFRFSVDFNKALKASGIAEPRGLEVELPTGEKINAGVFTAVNEEKFRALPDETVLEWHRKGWLHPIYFHLQSLNNWDALLARTSARMTAAAAVV